MGQRYSGYQVVDPREPPVSELFCEAASSFCFPRSWCSRGDAPVDTLANLVGTFDDEEQDSSRFNGRRREDAVHAWRVCIRLGLLYLAVAAVPVVLLYRTGTETYGGGCSVANELAALRIRAGTPDESLRYPIGMQVQACNPLDCYDTDAGAAEALRLRMWERGRYPAPGRPLVVVGSQRHRREHGVVVALRDVANGTEYLIRDTGLQPLRVVAKQGAPNECPRFPLCTQVRVDVRVAVCGKDPEIAGALRLWAWRPGNCPTSDQEVLTVVGSAVDKGAGAYALALRSDSGEEYIVDATSARPAVPPSREVLEPLEASQCPAASAYMGEAKEAAKTGHGALAESGIARCCSPGDQTCPPAHGQEPGRCAVSGARPRYIFWVAALLMLVVKVGCLDLRALPTEGYAWAAALELVLWYGPSAFMMFRVLGDLAPHFKTELVPGKASSGLLVLHARGMGKEPHHGRCGEFQSMADLAGKTALYFHPHFMVFFVLGAICYSAAQLVRLRRLSRPVLRVLCGMQLHLLGMSVQAPEELEHLKDAVAEARGISRPNRTWERMSGRSEAHSRISGRSDNSSAERRNAGSPPRQPSLHGDRELPHRVRHALNDMARFRLAQFSWGFLFESAAFTLWIPVHLVRVEPCASLYPQGAFLLWGLGAEPHFPHFLRYAMWALVALFLAVALSESFHLCRSGAHNKLTGLFWATVGGIFALCGYVRWVIGDPGPGGGGAQGFAASLGTAGQGEDVCSVLVGSDLAKLLENMVGMGAALDWQQLLLLWSFLPWVLQFVLLEVRMAGVASCNCLDPLTEDLDALVEELWENEEDTHNSQDSKRVVLLAQRRLRERLQIAREQDKQSDALFHHLAEHWHDLFESNSHWDPPIGLPSSAFMPGSYQNEHEKWTARVERGTILIEGLGSISIMFFLLVNGILFVYYAQLFGFSAATWYRSQVAPMFLHPFEVWRRHSVSDWLILSALRDLWFCQMVRYSGTHDFDHPVLWLSIVAFTLVLGPVRLCLLDWWTPCAHRIFAPASALEAVRVPLAMIFLLALALLNKELTEARKNMRLEEPIEKTAHEASHELVLRLRNAEGSSRPVLRDHHESREAYWRKRQGDVDDEYERMEQVHRTYSGADASRGYTGTDASRGRQQHRPASRRDTGSRSGSRRDFGSEADPLRTVVEMSGLGGASSRSRSARDFEGTTDNRRTQQGWATSSLFGSRAYA